MIPALYFGFFSLNSYGFFIVLGLLAFYHAIRSNNRFNKLLTDDQLQQLIVWCTVIGIAGGRVLYIIQNPSQFQSFYDVIALWEGGLSVLGSVIAIGATLPMLSHYFQLPTLDILDLAAVHAPLLHGISRIGCFMAGCCAGAVTDSWLSVTYTHPESMAPLCTALHPSQLYSALMLLMLYIFMRYFAQKRLYTPGALSCIYLTTAGLERCLNDFFRAGYHPIMFGLSESQLLALGIMIVGICGFCILHFTSHKHRIHESV